MEIDELVAYAEAIQRPCYQLFEAKPGEQVVAQWGGSRDDIKLEGNRHILSWDFELTFKLGIQRRNPFALITWTNPRGDEQPRLQPAKPQAFGDIPFKDTTPLSARSATSFPPFEALCLYGDQRIGEWLKSIGLERWDYEDANAVLREQYQEIYQQRCPLYTEPSIVAQLGGWHSIWPDDDYYIPREMQMLCWTFRDAEPWYEIFLSAAGNTVLKERAT